MGYFGLLLENCEIITNPDIYVMDMAAVQKVAAQYNLTLIVDNSFLSPYLVRPLAFGADIVVHSATKYLCGHGDTLGGAILGSQDLIDKARQKLGVFGPCLSPQSAWLLLRGIRTLPLRMRQHCANALALAIFLDSHKRVEWVHYPGLVSHPQHQLAKLQLVNGCGGMIAFKLHGGTEEMKQFIDSLTLAQIGVSLGDVYTLIYGSAHNGNLIRTSVGCEDSDDLIADFSQALESLA